MKNKKSIEENQLTTATTEEALDKKETDEEKVSPAVVLSICIFIIALVSMIALVMVVRNKNNKPAPAPQQPTQQESVQPDVTPTVNDNNAQSVATHDLYPEGTLNNNSLPYYEYTRENYEKYLDSVSSVTVNSDIDQLAAQKVKESFVCFLDLMGDVDTNHILVVDDVVGSWYSVKDSTYDYEFWVNRDLNVVMSKAEGYDPNVQYNIMSAIENYYGVRGLDIYYSEELDGVGYAAMVLDTNDMIIVDKVSMEVTAVEHYREGD